MQRFKVSLLAACGLLILAAVLGAIGPKRALAALGYTPVRDVDNVGRQPFAIQVTCSGNNASNFTVPGPGKRLVITSVSALGFGQTDEAVAVSTTVVGTPSTLFAPYTHPGTQSWASIAGNALAYADSGTTVSVFEHGPDQALVEIHGYFVDVP